MTEEEAEWVPRSVACFLIGSGLGLGRPISAYTLKQLAEDGKIEIRTLGGPKKARYFVLKASIQRFLSNGNGDK